MHLYIDFDNTIVESSKRVINILNKRYGINKKESDLRDYNFRSIYPVSPTEISDIFDSDDFFEKLEFKKGFVSFFKKYKSMLPITIVSKGTKINIEKKRHWIKENLDEYIEVIRVQADDLSKKKVNMKNGVQIDDCTKALNTNATIKVLYKSGNNFEWQQDYENTNIIVANSWEEIDELLKFYLKYNYTNLEVKDEKSNNH